MKNRLFLLLCLSWMFLHSLDAHAMNRRYFFVTIPTHLNFDKYDYTLITKYVNHSGSPLGCSFNFIHKKPAEVFRCEIWSDFNSEYEDTLIDVEFIVRSWKWGEEYTVHKVQVEVKTDSVFYTIPELPNEATIDAILKAKNKAFNKAHRGEGFTDFMTDWDSRFLYVNFYQGNRLFGEVSFSTARYEEIQTGNPFSRYRSSEPGFVRGPVYGAEFNFLWRKNDFILGPKFGFQIASRYVNLGLSAVYYTDFTHGSFCLKPRIGINPGVPWVNFSYEYAIRFGQNVFGNRINRHQFSVYFVIPLKLEE